MREANGISEPTDGSMSEAAAFELLELDARASSEQVMSAFHRLTHETHPDIPKGANDRMRTLLKAREVALLTVASRQLPTRYEKPISDLVVAEVSKQLARTENVVKATQRYATIGATFTRRAGDTRRAGVWTGSVGVFLALVTFVAMKVVPVVKEVPYIGFAAAALLLALTILLVVKTVTAEGTHTRIAQFAETLDDRELYLRTLSEALTTAYLKIGQKWTRENIGWQQRFERSYYRTKDDSRWTALKRWLVSQSKPRSVLEAVAHDIGWERLSTLIIASGLAHGLLRRVEDTSEGGTIEVSYVLDPPPPHPTAGPDE